MDLLLKRLEFFFRQQIIRTFARINAHPMIFPPLLSELDTVRLVSPAGNIESELLDGAERTLNTWGWNVKQGASAAHVYGRYAGTVEERLHDLQEAFDDPQCKAIFCSRGGYGAIQLIDKLDLNGFKRHPKWLIGFSDITLLHALLQQQGYASIHGGMAKRLATGDDPLVSIPCGKPLELLHELLTGTKPEMNIPPHPLNRKGRGKGPLRGGNLSILYSLRGTSLDYLPEGCVLFLEDTGEKPYAVDRMMHNLKLGGILKHLSGLIVGQFSDFPEDPLMLKSVYELIADSVSEYDYPVCFDFPVGHTEQNIPLLMGSGVELIVQENGVHLSYDCC